MSAENPLYDLNLMRAERRIAEHPGQRPVQFGIAPSSCSALFHHASPCDHHKKFSSILIQ